MPLIKSASPEAFKSNLKAELAANKPRAQALAIAFRIQRDAKRMVNGGRVKRADGGYIPFSARESARQLERSGFIRSPTGGRSDRLSMGAAPNSYVFPADAVSALGQGNSLAGAATLDHLFKSAPYGAAMPRMRTGRGPMSGSLRMPTRGMMRGRRGFQDGGMTPDEGMAPPVDIKASGGEYIVHPEKVAEIGDGDVTRGHDILDEMVKQIRAKSIKSLRSLPPPRTS